jgi:sugar lactone lactonase YvrE
MDWRVVVPCANALGEGPHWDPRSQVLWWIDVIGCKLSRYTLADQTVQEWETPRFPAAIAQYGESALVINGRNWTAHFDPNTGSWTTLDLEGIDFSVERLNDGRVDAMGRWWTGSMDRQLKAPIGGLYCWSSGNQWVRHADGIELGNGIGWSPDSRWIYVTDTPARMIYRYAFDLEGGQVGARSNWVEIPEGGGHPDGLTVDAEGHIWSAQIGAGAINRYNPEGVLVATLHVPVPRPTSVTFGGPEMKTIFVTTATLDLAPGQAHQYPESGHLFALETDIRGVTENRLQLSIPI